jgi:hypothetical protein
MSEVSATINYKIPLTSPSLSGFRSTIDDVNSGNLKIRKYDVSRHSYDFIQVIVIILALEKLLSET